MTPQEFHAVVDSGNPGPVYLFCPYNTSFEPVLAEEAIRHAIDRFVEPSLRDLAYSVYYADETESGEVVDTARTVPFLSDRRVVVVHRAELYQSENAVKPLLEYLETPSDLTVLLLVANQVDKRTKFYRACKKAGAIVECGELHEAAVRAWAREKAAAEGKEIAEAALRELVDRTGTGLSAVQNAIRVVCAYVGDRERIEQADVERACSSVREEIIWALTDAIADSKTDKALRVLRQMIDSGENEFQILGAINWLLKSAYATVVGGPLQAGLKPFVARKVRPLGEKIGMKKFPDAFALCMDTDLMMRSTGVDRLLALELLVVKLATPFRAASRT